ncbi:hypothetical protein NDU88_004967 [Pleurodeles waltl]|uniref:Uncharacterized protein n=1 Tax=Pleurodeles waltl TaxID=8319 RepID=A0AAV7V6C9_PLEWA|nr:hypothetical protein NDU88_004967 [Pleurodeles waltl]
MLLAQEEGQYLQCVAGFVRVIDFRSKGLPQPPLQQRFVRGRNGDEGPQCACRVSRGSISATDSPPCRCTSPRLQSRCPGDNHSVPRHRGLDRCARWPAGEGGKGKGPRDEPCTHCQGGSHRWRCVVEGFRSGIHVSAIFLKLVFEGLLVEWQSWSGPLRLHASSAVHARGTSLQCECFPSHPGWRQAAAPQRAWGQTGADPRVAQGQPSNFGGERASVTERAPGPSREHEPQSAHCPGGT